MSADCGNMNGVLRHPSRRQSGRWTRLGFTLLEVIVAIGLTTFIVGVIGTAIRMYFVNLKQAQANMELTELARNTLNLITSDIRGAIQYKPVDVSGLQELLDSQAASISPPSSDDENGDESGDGETGDDSLNDSGSGGESGGMQQKSSGTSSADVAPPEDRPKFVGTDQELHVDVSRLPRIDQYHPILHMNSNGSYNSLPTDIKSVSYFVTFAGEQSSPVPGGLYRREVDRATLGGASNAGWFNTDAAAKQVAAEIVSLSFRYFDGESWQSEWDSDQAGGFPSAVEVEIIIDPERMNPVAGAAYDLAAADPNTLRTFRSVVSLPLAELLSEDEQKLIANPTEFKSPTEESNAGEGEQ